jgi:hypothetical protein
MNSGPSINTRARFEQWAKNPECEANTVSAVLNVRMGQVAASLGLEDKKGISPFAVTRGYLFERSLFEDDAQLLRPQLERKKVLPADSSGLLDLRLKSNFGTDVSTMDEALEKSVQFLEGASQARTLPSLVTGLTLRLPQGVMLPEATLVMDVMSVSRKQGKVHVRVGEIKVFPDRGGYTDPDHLATARAQAGVYLYALESWLEARSLSAQFELDPKGFLVFSWPGSAQPVVRANEDLSEQKERARRGFSSLDSVAQRVVGVRIEEFNPDEYEAWVKHSSTAYAEKCWGFCDLAPRCQKLALIQDKGIVLGDQVARGLGGIPLTRAVALLNGDTPMDSTEESLATQLGAADWESNVNP